MSIMLMLCVPLKRTAENFPPRSRSALVLLDTQSQTPSHKVEIKVVVMLGLKRQSGVHNDSQRMVTSMIVVLQIQFLRPISQ